MSEPDQRCENCKFWKWAELDRCEADFAIGFCMFPQDLLPESADLRQMYADEGTTCPCWAPIENGEAE